MESVITFTEFMGQHRTRSCRNTTHVGLGGLLKGKFSIKDDEEDEFFELYSAAVVEGEQLFSLEESPRELGPCRVDIELRFRSSMEVERKYGDSHIKAVARAYQTVFKQTLVAEPESLVAYCFEKDAPYTNATGSISDSFQIIFPHVVANTEYFLYCRRKVIQMLDQGDSFGDLDLTNTLDDIVVRAAIESNGWLLYGSPKPSSTPFVLSKVLGVEELFDDFDQTIDSTCFAPMVSLLSIRNKSETPTEQSTDFDWRQEMATLSPPARPASSQSRPLTVGSHDTEDVVALVDMLCKRRSDNFSDWMRVGWCLYNMGESTNKNYLPLWKHFSALSIKYREKKVDAAWEKMHLKSASLGMSSLRWWAKEDSPDRYHAFVLENLTPVLEESVRSSYAGTSYDVAKVVRTLFPTDHVCTNIKSQTWYSFMNGRWRESRQGYHLRIELSTTVFEKFCQLAAVLNQRAADTQKQEFLERAKLANQLAKKLRERKFKQDILAECADMFYDPEFMSRLNTNKMLLGFDNGVYDLQTMNFRRGQPEDYVTLSCGYKYQESTEADRAHVTTFLREVFVDKDIYKYMRLFLGSLLEGEIRDHRFHFCTGCGSNGKSVLWDCLDKVLGGYSCVIPVAFLTNKRAQSNQAAPEIARAAGARLLQFYEPEKGAVFNEGLMKELTSDTIVVRHLFGESFEIDPQWKLVMMCNKLPAINSYDGGTWRRVRVVEFASHFVDIPSSDKPMEFKRDDGVKNRLTQNKMAFMSVLIECYREFRDNKFNLRAPKVITDRTRKYKTKSDLFVCYVDETLMDEVEGNRGKSMNDLYATFTQWYRESGNAPKNPPPKSEFKDYFELKYSDRKLGTRWMFRDQNEENLDNWEFQGE